MNIPTCTKCKEPWMPDHICNTERVARLEAENARFTDAAKAYTEAGSAATLQWEQRATRATADIIRLHDSLNGEARARIAAEAERDELQRDANRINCARWKAEAERDALREVVTAAKAWGECPFPLSDTAHHDIDLALIDALAKLEAAS